MSKSKLKSAVDIASSYKINDRRGTDTFSNGGDKQALGLYSTPFYNQQSYTPRLYVTPTDTKKAVTRGERQKQDAYGRALFSSLPELGAGLCNKADWAVGQNAFTPVHTGEDLPWGETVEDWLQTSVYPYCNVQGANFDFRKSLWLDSVAMDVSGDSLMVLTKTRAGNPSFAIYPSHRIGSRESSDLIKEGKYAGYEMVDGAIINADGRPVAYRILGDTEDEDYDAPVNACQLLFEPEWHDQYRGISKIARPLANLLHYQDVQEFILQGIQLATSEGLIVHTESGDAPASTNIIGLNEDTTTANTGSVPFQRVIGPGFRYVKAGVGEKIESLKDERPSQNTQAFIEDIKRGSLSAVGWPIELLDPSKVGGASVRLIQDIARKTIAKRQETLEKRAQFFITYAVAVGMSNGSIPKSNKDWWRWSFSKGAQICVDQGNEANADREGYKLGLQSLQEITSKRGLDWYDVRAQNEKEVADLLERSQRLAKQFNVPFETTLVLMQQSTPNASPTAPPVSQPVMQPDDKQK
jgi:hypothetical protein